MNFKELLGDALPLISKFAPTIGGAIGGPVGVAAGYIIPILASAFGVSPRDIPALAQKIIGDPDAYTKLQQIETEHGDWIDSLMDSVNNLSSAEISIKLEWQKN